MNTVAPIHMPCETGCTALGVANANPLQEGRTYRPGTTVTRYGAGGYMERTVHEDGSVFAASFRLCDSHRGV